MYRLTPSREKRRIAEQTTSLHEAAVLNQSDLAVQLVDQDPSQVDARDHNGRTPLHRACGRGHHGTVSVLLALRADVKATDKHGQTPLHWAVFAGCSVTVDVLLEMGANATTPDKNGRTPAHVAVAKGVDGILQLLIQAGAFNPGEDWPGPGKKWSLRSFWADDLEASFCMCCRTRAFSVQTRRHHCRQCGDVICRTCAVRAKPPWHTPGEKSELVCTSCTKVWATEDKSKGIYNSRTFADKSELLERELRQDDFDELHAFYWFYSDWSRVDAEAALQNDGVLPGDFVCRPSSYPDSVALSILVSRVDVQHFLIQYYNEGWFLKLPSATGRYTSFDSVVELLRHHIRTGIELASSTLRLTRPYVSLDDGRARQLRGDILTAQRPQTESSPAAAANGDGDTFETPENRKGSLPYGVGAAPRMVSVTDILATKRRVTHGESVSYGVATTPEQIDSRAFDTPFSDDNGENDVNSMDPAKPPKVQRHNSQILFVPEDSEPSSENGTGYGTPANGWATPQSATSSANGVALESQDGGADTSGGDNARDSAILWAQAGATSPAGDGSHERVQSEAEEAGDGDGYDSGSYYEGSDDDGPSAIPAGGVEETEASQTFFRWSWRPADLAAPPLPPEIDDTMPTFPDPAFPSSGIPEVDDKIRAGILKQCADQFSADLRVRCQAREDGIGVRVAQLEIQRAIAYADLATAAESALALSARESLRAISEVIDTSTQLLAALDTAPPALLEQLEQWEQHREERAAEVDAALQGDCTDRVEQGRAALAEANTQQANDSPVELDALHRASADLANFKATNWDFLVEATRAHLDSILAEWAAAETQLSEWEQERARIEVEQVRAATTIQAGFRGMAARKQTRVQLEALAELRAEQSRVRATEREVLAVQWAAAEAETDIDTRLAAMDITLVAAAALPTIGMPDRVLEGIMSAWTTVVDDIRREQRIEAEKSKVQEILERGQEAFLELSEIDALRDVVAEGRECEPTDELKMYLTIWSRAVQSRELQQQTQRVLERGYTAVQSGKTDAATAELLNECIQTARELPENEILSGAISTWESAATQMRPKSLGVAAEHGNLAVPSTSPTALPTDGAWTARDALYDIDRDMAELCLRQRELDNGAFILRQSASIPGQYTLSVRLMDVIKHYRLNASKTGKFLLRGSNLAFDSITALLRNYTNSKTNDILATKLSAPCPRRIVEEQLAVLHIRLCDKCALQGKADDQFCEHCGSKYARPLTAVNMSAKKTPDAWELKRANVSFRGLLGTGNFGEVRQGVLGADIDVAIKTSKADRMSTKTFLEEAQKMKKLLHPNLCRLLGVCTLEDPILMVMECVGGGSLEDWLHSKRGRGMPITLQCRFLADISAGMAFMQDRHWVHGDLASRNILVSSSGNTLKICDFGHAVRCAEDNVPVVVAHQLPVRWCAPEFFRTRKCNPAVDAWSFGVVVFEVLTRALEPYADMPENKKVIAKLEAGWRMPRTKSIHVPFYDMMLDCWHAMPDNRPRFSHIHTLCKQWEASGPLRQTSRGELVGKDGGKLTYQSGPVCGDVVPTPPDPEVKRPASRKARRP